MVWLNGIQLCIQLRLFCDIFDSPTFYNFYFYVEIDLKVGQTETSVTSTTWESIGKWHCCRTMPKTKFYLISEKRNCKGIGTDWFVFIYHSTVNGCQNCMITGHAKGEDSFHSNIWVCCRLIPLKSFSLFLLGFFHWINSNHKNFDKTVEK